MPTVRLDSTKVALATLRISASYLPDVIHMAEELPPVSVERLGAPQLERQALVVAQSSDQVRLGPRLDHLKLIIRDVFLFHTFDLRVNSVAGFVGRVPGSGHGEDHEQVRIFGA